MKKVRLLSAGAIAGMAGIIVLPMTAHADATQPTGSAQASALQVSISPSALISAVPAVGSLLSSTLGGVLGDTDLSIKIDAANANGVLDGNLLDLLSGHGDSTPIDISSPRSSRSWTRSPARSRPSSAPSTASPVSSAAPAA